MPDDYLDSGLSGTDEQTPEQEEAARVAEFGYFAKSHIDTNMETKECTVTLDDVLPGKNKIEVTTDTAFVAFAVFSEVTSVLQRIADGLKKDRANL